MGYLDDDENLATAYRAADVFVCPSIEDAGPMMIPKRCCVERRWLRSIQAAPDLVITGQTGYLARVGDAADVARGIEHVLTS